MLPRPADSHGRVDGSLQMIATTHYLTIAQFAAYSGLSDKTIRRRIAEHQLPFHQPGGMGTKIVLPVDALDRAAAARTSSAMASPDDSFTPSTEQEIPSRRLLPGPKPRWR